jgi:hypothetical protein
MHGRVGSLLAEVAQSAVNSILQVCKSSIFAIMPSLLTIDVPLFKPRTVKSRAGRLEVPLEAPLTVIVRTS